MPLSGRYSQYARRAMMQARLCARDFQHTQVDTSHLLVGILRTEGCLGHHALTGLGLSRTTTENAIALLHLRRAVDSSDPIPMSDPLRAALTRAVEEARALGQATVGTEHLLLGLARGASGAAQDILEASEVSFEQVREEVVRLLEEGRSEIAQEVSQRTARLSEPARDVLARAAVLATRTGQTRPALLHLLLALAQAGGPAGDLLRACGLDADRLARDAAVPVRGAGPDALDAVVDDAVLVAERLGSATADIPHLVVILARGRYGARLLPRYGVDLALLRQRVAALLRAH